MYRVTAADLRIREKVAPLVFARYAWLPESTTVRDAGSGILVAPGLGLFAKHVSKSFEKLDARLEGQRRRATPFDQQYTIKKSIPEFATLAYQSLSEDVNRIWRVSVDWPSHDTDITVLVMDPESPAAKEAAPTLTFLEWQLLPPHWRAKVRVYGWPQQDILIKDRDHFVAAELWEQPAQVVENCYPLNVHGFGEFPVFRIDRSLDAGFSGGPVLYEDVLVGIFTGPDLVSPLWPLAIHAYPDQEGVERSIAEHFDIGTIVARDWDQVKGRVERQDCEVALAGSALESRCVRKHVVLRNADSAG